MCTHVDCMYTCKHAHLFYIVHTVCLSCFRAVIVGLPQNGTKIEPGDPQGDNFSSVLHEIICAQSRFISCQSCMLSDIVYCFSGSVSVSLDYK